MNVFLVPEKFENKKKTGNLNGNRKLDGSRRKKFV